MTGTTMIFILLLIWCYWLDWVNDEIIEEEEEQEEEVKDNSVFSNQLCLMHGITKPLPFCDIEAVEEMEWDVVYNGKRIKETIVSHELKIINRNDT